jgi:hypothetical protein
MRREVKIPVRSQGRVESAPRKWPAFRWDWLVVLFTLVVLCRMVTDGDWNLFQPAGYMEEFYDAQAQSLLHGRIDVVKEAIDREAFVRNGKYYGYFGPTPALARIPLNVLLPGMYGRWSRFSMWLGSAVILASLMLLFRRLEELLQLKGRLWGLLRGTLTVAVALGSTNLFLVMESKVYQEAIMWGSALAFAHAVCLLCFLLDPKGKWLALACAAAFLSFFARVSSGAGTLLALLIVDLALLLPSGRFREFWGVPAVATKRRVVAVLTATLVVSSVLWAGLNYWKFGIWFTSQPLNITIDSDPWRMQRTKGDAASLLNIPMTLPIYFWLPNVEFQAAFPWAWLKPVDRDLAQRYPYAHFDGIEPVGSLPFTVPALFVAALAGSGLCFLGGRRQRPGVSGAPLCVIQPSLRAFRAPLCGAFAGIFLVLTWGYISYRYMQDALPWLALGAAIAVAHIPLAERKWMRHALTGLLLAGTAYGVWVNGAFAVVQKRIYAFPEPDTKHLEFLDMAAAIQHGGVSGWLHHVTHWRTYIYAADYKRGNVSADGAKFTRRADHSVIFRDGPPPGAAEYEVTIPEPGLYEFSLVYASADSRPLRFFLNGREAPKTICAEPTGGFTEAYQRWAPAASSRLSAGVKTFALVSAGEFPVVRMIRVVRID